MAASGKAPMTARVLVPVTALLTLASSLALAQTAPIQLQPNAAPRQLPKAAPAHKAAPRPRPPATAKKPQPPAAAQKQAPPAAEAAAGPQAAVVYSPWVKFCNKASPETDNKDVCLTVKDVRLENGRPIANVLLTERAGEDKKTLRVTLPLGLQIVPGARMSIDGAQPVIGTYSSCVPNGCTVDFTVDAGFVDRLKKGQFLRVQGIDMQGKVMQYPLPLADFASANEGAPSDPLTFENEQKREWEERLRNLAAQKK